MDQQNNAENPVKKEQKPKKKAKKKIVAKSAANKAGIISAPAVKPGKRGGNLFVFVMAVAITAAITGGSIFAWQKKVIKEKIDGVKNEAQSITMNFESRLSDIKDKMKNIETENSELKTTNETLQSKTKLLEEAKIEFISPELGMSFEYPAILGEVKLAISEEEGGKRFTGGFSDNDKIIFGGLSAGNKGTTTALFIDTFGFKQRKGKYYFKAAVNGAETEYEINPIKTAGSAVIVDKNSFSAAGEAGLALLGEKELGAVVNLNGDTFPAAAFWNKDTDSFSLIDFGAIIESVQLK